MNIEKKTSFVYTIIIYLSTRIVICAGANYNTLVLVFVILGINLELSKNNKKIINIIKGVNLFFVFMSKQNIFIYYVIALLIIYIIKVKQNKIRVKEMIYISTSFLLPMTLFIIHLKYNGIIEEFISYCFLGVLEFSNKNKAIELDAIGYIVADLLSIFFSILLICLKSVDKKIKNINHIILPFSIFLLFIIYPIFNVYHTLLGSVVSIMLLIYNLHSIFVIEFIGKKKLNCILNIFIILCTTYFIGYNIYYSYAYIKSKKMCTDIEIYKYIIIDDEMKNKINIICKYIEENESQGVEVKIISYEANLFMNILNKNNKNMDLPFLGNFGENGEDGVIEEIKKLKNGTKILITHDEIKKYEIAQESKKINEFIMNNFKKIGEIEDFYIYEK